MATLPLSNLSATDEVSAVGPAPKPRWLATARVGETLKVVSLAIEADLRAWLAAVGIEEGERLTLLRRAAFGGPLHVRTRAGGEFALNVALARSIEVGAVIDDNPADP
jgi:ferrous iron transport protein A